MAQHNSPTPASLEARDDAPLDRANLPHDNYGPSVNVIIWVLTGAAGLFLALRMFCKYIRGKKMWWDDYVLIASFVFLIAQTSLLSVLVHLGFGTHWWDITDWYPYLLIANITGVCSIIAAAWSKTSFAILLLRFTDGWKRRLVWFVIVTVNIFLGLSALLNWVQCTPIRKLYLPLVPGKCWDQNIISRYSSFASAWSGAMDILLAALPWLIINRRSLNRKERLGVLVAMSMGAIAGLTSISKTATLSSISSNDALTAVALMSLATAETALTIIASSIPYLRILVKNTMQGNSTPPEFFRSWFSRGSPAAGNGDVVLTVPTSTLTRSSNAVGLSTQSSDPSSSAMRSPEKPPQEVDNGWLNSGSESGLGSPLSEKH